MNWGGRRWLALAALFGLLAGALLTTPAKAQEELPVLAEVGPWPVVSRLVAFRGRLWLANSVKGVNHNSADLYSLDPADGTLRYERHLFSQDAGRPVVARGQLYWPFEDSRFSVGWGHYLATDGSSWRFGTIPAARAFHVHAMAAGNEQLVAATSAWRAGFQVSSDGGATWQEAYDHPTPERRVSRIVQLVSLGDLVLGPVTLRGERRLLSFDGQTVSEVPDWPQENGVLDLIAWNGGIFGLVAEPEGTQLWRTDGFDSQKIGSPLGDTTLGLAADESGLWRLDSQADSGTLWHSADGIVWRLHYRFSGGRPLEALVVGGRAYVAGAGTDGRGILWGTRGPWPAKTEEEPPAPVETASASDGGVEELSSELDRALANPGSYEGHGRALRDLVHRIVRAGLAGAILPSRLEGPRPALTISLIGGATQADAATLARWILLWGMAVAGEGRVPLPLIEAPWTLPPNRSEKYFGVAPAAIWAAAMIGQKDRATIGALVDRLQQAGDPDWLRGDVIGALTALTDQRFAYDIAAWRGWWDGAAAAWPE